MVLDEKCTARNFLWVRKTSDNLLREKFVFLYQTEMKIWMKRSICQQLNMKQKLIILGFSICYIILVEKLLFISESFRYIFSEISEYEARF